MSSSVSISLSSNSNTRSARSCGIFGSAAMMTARRRFVQDSPEHAQVLDRFEERVEVDGLHHERVHAELVAAHQIAFLTRGGQHYDRNASVFRIALDAFQHLESIDLR